MLTPEQIEALPCNDSKISELVKAAELTFQCVHCGTPKDAGFINECCCDREFTVDGVDPDAVLIRHLLSALADANLRIAELERGAVPEGKRLMREPVADKQSAKRLSQLGIIAFLQDQRDGYAGVGDAENADYYQALIDRLLALGYAPLGMKLVPMSWPEVNGKVLVEESELRALIESSCRNCHECELSSNHSYGATCDGDLTRGQCRAALLERFGIAQEP